MTSPWKEGTVYLSASVESERTMVDLASLELLVGLLLCGFSLSEELEAVAPLVSGRSSSTGSRPIERHPPLKHWGLEVATNKEVPDGSNAMRIGLPPKHGSNVWRVDGVKISTIKLNGDLPK